MSSTALVTDAGRGSANTFAGLACPFDPNARAPRQGRAGLARLVSRVLWAFLLVACTSPGTRFGPMPMGAPLVVDEPYRIRPGDELEIRFFHTPDQDVTVPVRPDGIIAVPLAHEVRAAGRTVEELRLELVERCSSELNDPEITVIVRTFAGYEVHVGGEVARPGVLHLDGPRTVLGAVFEAGGLLPTASASDVLVVRRLEPRGYELLRADLDALLHGRDAGGDFVLRPFDVVFVPTTAIADVNRWVDQYLRKNVPINFSLTYRLDDPNN